MKSSLDCGTHGTECAATLTAKPTAKSATKQTIDWNDSEQKLKPQNQEKAQGQWNNIEKGLRL